MSVWYEATVQYHQHTETLKDVNKKNTFENKVYDQLYFNCIQKAPSIVKYSNQ